VPILTTSSEEEKGGKGVHHHPRPRSRGGKKKFKALSSRIRGKPSPLSGKHAEVPKEKRPCFFFFHRKRKGEKKLFFPFPSARGEKKTEGNSFGGSDPAFASHAARKTKEKGRPFHLCAKRKKGRRSLGATNRRGGKKT